MSKALLKTLTPVHVGSGVKYLPMLDFVKEKEQIIIINPEKIFQRIGIAGVNDWLNFIENEEYRNKDKDIKSFLINKKINPEDVVLRKCQFSGSIKKNKELHEQINSPFCGFYIPGSSIKGAINTCLLGYLTDKHSAKLNSISIDDIKKKEKGKEEVVWKDDKLEEEFIGKSANYSLTRFIKVGDAFFGDISTRVYYSTALNADKEGWYVNGNIANLYEAIPENKNSFFELKFDKELIELNKKYVKEEFPYTFNSFDLQNIYSVVNNQTSRAVNNEIKFFEKLKLPREGKKMLAQLKSILEEIERCNNSEFIIRIGANSGYNFMTLRLVDKLPIFQSEKGRNEYVELRKSIQKNSFHKIYPPEEPWPRTRKITFDGVPFGFVKIKLFSDQEYIKYLETQKIAEIKGERKASTSAHITETQKTPVEPEPYKGKIKQGTDHIPALVYESGRPNKVKLLIEGMNIMLPLSGYASEIKVNTYIYVRITQFSNNQIKQVNFQDYIK